MAGPAPAASTEMPATLRALIGVRLAAGTILLAFPGRVLGVLSHRRTDGTARAFVRLLGVRHLVEAAVLWRRPTHRWVELGAAVDGTHAATMVALAVARPADRRAATANALAAGALAAAGVAEGRALRGRTAARP